MVRAQANSPQPASTLDSCYHRDFLAAQSPAFDQDYVNYLLHIHGSIHIVFCECEVDRTNDPARCSASAHGALRGAGRFGASLGLPMLYTAPTST